ncbi:formimidoylglutamase [Oceanicaulis alexandrii]|uniref:formimidoylglutamase n=1 Tax=Oceanicaulis alexandrii TaxID=153233 RepID=UPI0035CFBB68
MSVTRTQAPEWTGRLDPEDGSDAIRLHQLVTPDAKRAVIGFACDAGVKRNKGRVGAKDGPAALRQALANLAAPQNALAFSDLGDVVVTGDALEAGQDTLANAIADALSLHDRLVVLGGGHETAFASYQGLRKRYPDARIGILNLDAHLDLRLPGEAGGSSGTPFAQIRALDPERFDYLCVGYAEEANTQALFKRAQDWGVGLVRDHDLISDPLAANRAISELIARNDRVYLTIDIDVLSHCQAPGVSAPAARGVPLATIEQIVGFVIAKAGDRLALADLVELCPAYDQDGVTAKTAALLARRLLMSV